MRRLIDPLISAIIAAIALVGWRLLREVASVLLKTSPRELNFTDPSRALTATGGVKAVLASRTGGV